MTAAAMSQTDENLVSILERTFEFRVNISDIKKCDPDVVQKIYVHFVRDMGASLEHINDVPFGMSENVQQYPETYRGVMRMIMLAQVIRSFMQYIFNDDSFMPADLFDPKPKRTKHFFWLICEYYTLMPDNRFNEICEQIQLKEEKEIEMEEKTQKLKEEVQRLRLEKAEFKIQEEEEEKRLAAERQKLSQTQEWKVELKNDVESHQLNISSLTTNIKEAELHYIQGSERVRELETQVVQDSERVAINQREDHMTQLRTSLGEKKEHRSQLQQKLSTMEQTCESIALVQSAIQDIAREINKAKEAQGVGASQKQDIISVQVEIEDKAMEIQDWMQRLETEQTMMAQMQQTWKMKHQSILDEIKQHKQTLEESRRNRTEDEIACQDMEDEFNRLTSEISKYTEQIVVIDNFIACNYKKVLDVMEKKKNNLEAVLDGVVKAIESQRKTLSSSD